MACSFYDLNDSGACAQYQEIWERTRGIFASLTYAEAAGEAFNLLTKICFYREEAALLLHLGGSNLCRRVVIPPCTQYSALLLPDSPSAHKVHARKSSVDHLLGCAERIRRADLLVSLDDPRTAQWRGWEVSPRFTYLIPLPAAKSQWSSGARRAWQSKVSQYEIQEGMQYADQVIELCAQSYRRNGRSLPARPAALRKITQSMKPWVRVFAAIREDTAEAGMIILHDNATAHYWIAGSIPGPAMTVLIGEVLPILSQSGITTFDFVGANTPSIAEFKRSFGPVLTQYYHLRRRPRMQLGF